MTISTEKWLLPLLYLGFFGRTSSKLFGFGTPAVHIKISENFQFYWNVPTFMCHKYKMDFMQVSKKFGIVQNEKDDFRGDKVAILYDPGDFPALLKDNKDNIVRRNGGVPQEGDLALHLDYFRRHLDEQIRDKNYTGLAIIDFESWRPIFRQNWASLQIYRDLSIDIERQRHPFWNQKSVQQEASERFERFGRLFMQRTMELARHLRPHANWGYYAYPYCFNWTPNQQSAQCSSKVVEENDGWLACVQHASVKYRMSWLFGNATILLPSVYLKEKLTANQRVGLVRGRVQEAVRLSRKAQNQSNSKVLPYYWYKYQDKSNIFVEKRDLINTLGEIIKRGADGVIIWGSSSDLDSKAKCETFLDYLQQTLGPTILRLRMQLND